MRARATVGACVIFLAACTPAPLGKMPAAIELSIENPGGLVFDIVQVVEDERRMIAGDIPKRDFKVRLNAGIYQVVVHDGERRIGLPAPLLEAVAPEGGLTIRIPRVAHDDESWAWVPEGVALIGDTLGVGQEDERPAHLVQLREFWIARRETTNREYAAFLNDLGHPVDESWLALDSLKCLVRRNENTGAWSTTAPEMPIVTVSLAGAEAYCSWLTRRAGIRHRLPTEVEWEKAARGPASLNYDYGNVFRRLAANQESGRLRDVGSFSRNGFGVYDMTGNAFEWVVDGYDGEAYRDRRGRIVENPVCLPRSEQNGLSYHVLRGGSFVLDGMYLRNSFRMRQRPTVRTDDIGFRVVRESLEGPR